MPCPHGINQGYCHACLRIIRPTVTEIDLSHWMQAPREHRESGKCERCNRVKEKILHGKRT